MPALITEPDLRGMFDINLDVQDTRLKFAIAAASRRLRTMVGDAVYDDAADEATSEIDRRENLKSAEGHLAMHFAILGLNTQIRPSGVVKSERLEGEVVVNYLSPNEISQMAMQYLESAHEIARPYLLTDGVPEAQFDVAEIEEE